MILGYPRDPFGDSSLKKRASRRRRRRHRRGCRRRRRQNGAPSLLARVELSSLSSYSYPSRESGNRADCFAVIVIIKFNYLLCRADINNNNNNNDTGII